MRLLILTQAVDRNDPVLGFFHSWIREIAKVSTSVHVVCLKEGEHALPANTHVHSLGKEQAASRLMYLFRFYLYIFRHRRDYDSVFVHMNQEYVLLGGLLWRLLRKRIVLWRNHKVGSLWTRIAVRLSHVTCYTSREAYVATLPKTRQMPLGIDTQVFVPGEVRSRNSVLFLGRIDPIKNTDVFLDALHILKTEGVLFESDIYGEPTDTNSAHYKLVREKARLSGANLRGAVSNVEAAGVFRAHAVYVNLTPSGSFDKTIGEAMASGCLVIAANSEVGKVLPRDFFLDETTPTRVASVMKAALTMDIDSRRRVRESSRRFIEREHSLAMLIERLVALFNPQKT